ncbi:MAG TPA: FliM/FliN family flagellar motor switch protein [Kofleriaceae bacterium]|nr:FliM/FliN family flagellar motor switch protein [Kofleriaceae bacterium]
MSESFDDSPQFDPAQLEALLHDVPLEVSVELGRIRMNLSELAAHLGPGSILTLDTPTGAPLDVRVNNRLIARAEAIAIGEKCGIRIVELITSKEP